ncbi:hypothetical protein GGR50DRAFT_697007 [Xylaria sp. CBS 124048]|nr:hypothetical protein GGR50DRAFT_697007 [Xylaria sp. CBS 124048]
MERWYWNRTTIYSHEDEDELWPYTTLGMIYAGTTSLQLLPPGDFFRVESVKITRKGAVVRGAAEASARPTSKSHSPFIEMLFDDILWVLREHEFISNGIILTT